MAKKNPTCSFCGRVAEEVERMITANSGARICNECIDDCKELLHEEEAKNLFGDDRMSADENAATDVPVPKEIKEYLDNYVIGQEKAKRILSVAVYNHYKRILMHNQLDDKEIELEKSNVLLLGPTGSGKTLLARTLARKLRVPFAIADATTLTEAGYVGEDVENILLKLIQNADNNIKLAEKGIIYIDEIDKISKKNENTSITRDVSGEGVQQALLKLIEGTIASVPPQGGRKHPGQEMLKIDTKNILVICGGAFVGLDSIIEARIDRTPIGFGSDTKSTREKDLEQLFSQLLPDDLIKFGLIPEFIGRLPIHTSLNDLSRDDLIKVLIEPKNSVLRQYQEMLKLDQIRLDIELEALDAIADLAIKRKTGARGLRTILEEMLIDLMFELPSHNDETRIIITRDCVLKQDSAILLLGKSEVEKVWPKELYENKI